MATSWKVMALGVLALGQTYAAEPARVQDPPGKVSVDQPGGVSISERHTQQDATDTLRGGGRTDVIDGERPGVGRSGPDIRPAEGRGDVRAGSETRTSFEDKGGDDPRVPVERGTQPSSAAPARGAPAGGAGSTDADTSPLGTDHGYGTGTEPTPSR